MITPAVLELLKDASIVSLMDAESVYPSVVPQGEAMPFIVFSERGVPENFKDGSTITNYDVQVDVYSDKGKDGNGGFLECHNIGEAIKAVLDRYKGAKGSINIDQVVLESEEAIYDPVSEAARLILDFKFRIRI